ncbi:hypothetical protein [Nostoc sp. NZL]|uniref:hypothetical protein n=1 Tax=Nostoc sp. NZL TaxID=2650612 RepID=UPI003FA546D9
MIAIRINQYDYLQPLNYAKRDALLMQEFLGNEAGFERIFFFLDCLTWWLFRSQKRWLSRRESSLAWIESIR